MAVVVTRGLPLPADIILATDQVGSILKAQWLNLGTNAPSESGTLAQKAQSAVDKILGDGGSNAGIANSDLKARLQPVLKPIPLAYRYDALFSLCGPVFSALDNWILQNIPTGWNFNASDGSRPLDLWLRRLNAANASTPAAPSITPTLAATTGGSVGQSGVIRVKITVTGANDWLESQPSTASSTITLTGKNNAITVTCSGNAPVTGFVNVYRQLAGASSGDAYYFDQRLAIISGSAYPAITCIQADQDLRLDYQPPSWLQCMMLPEAAFLFAGGYGTLGANVGQQMGLATLPTQAFMNIANVTLNPSYVDASNTLGLLGLGNQPSSGQFAQWIATAFTEGVLAAANVPANGIQGFAGAAGSGVQLRVTSALNANAPITNVVYYWYDATHDFSVGIQGPTTIAAPGTLNLAQGQTLDVGIPAGRLVTRISAFTVGTAVTGTIVAEAKALRAI